MNTNSGIYTVDPTSNTASVDLNGFDAPININCTVESYTLDETTNFGGLTLLGTASSC